MTSTFCLTIVQFSSNLFDRNSPANDRPEMSLIGARLPPFHANSRFRSSPSPSRSLNLESKIKFLWLHAGMRGEGGENGGGDVWFSFFQLMREGSGLERERFWYSNRIEVISE